MQNSSTGPRTVSCPTCAAPVEWSELQKWRPFCSKRCYMIDLGSWLDESNRIPSTDFIPSATEQDQ
jgi:endogenous inhibitor of DNA gyrase (YacG/DUF329 family)